MSPRKKWSTTWPQIPGGNRMSHPSETAVYRWVARQAELWHRGSLRSSMVNVWVDERAGAGWELHTHMDLRDVKL